MLAAGQLKHLLDRRGATTTAGAAYGLNPDGIQDIRNHIAVIILTCQCGHIDRFSAEDRPQDGVMP